MLNLVNILYLWKCMMLCRTKVETLVDSSKLKDIFEGYGGENFSPCILI